MTITEETKVNDSEFDINIYIRNKYHERFDNTIPTSHERLSLFDDLQNDHELIKHLDSSLHRNKQIKKKNSALSESDSTSTRLEFIASYILQPDYKEYNIRSKYQMKDIGQVRYKRKGKRYKFNRISYLEQMVNKINNHNDEDSYISSDELASQILKLDDTCSLWDIFDFSNPKQIKKLLHEYHKIIPEIENEPDTRIWSIVIVLNELIANTKLNLIDQYIVYLIRFRPQGYAAIRREVNRKFGTDYKYRTIEEKIRFTIPKKLSKTYIKKINNVNFDKTM